MAVLWDPFLGRARHQGTFESEVCTVASCVPGHVHVLTIYLEKLNPDSEHVYDRHASLEIYAHTCYLDCMNLC